MKKIYTFTLDVNEEDKQYFNDRLRLIAYMLYSEIYNYDCEYSNPLNINKNIIYNDLKNIHSKDDYCFDCETIDFDTIYYEPFIIGEKSFGFTVIDEKISENEINDLLKYVLSILDLDYKVVVRNFSYIADYIDDERYRKDAFKKIFEALDCDVEKKMPFMRLVKNIGNRIFRHRR